MNRQFEKRKVCESGNVEGVFATYEGTCGVWGRASPDDDSDPTFPCRSVAKRKAREPDETAKGQIHTKVEDAFLTIVSNNA